jgi:hypothetical protein
MKPSKFFFESGSFLEALKRGSKEILWPVCSERLEGLTKLKFCRGFVDSIQDLRILFSLIGWTLISNFPGKLRNILIFFIRLLMILHRFQKKLMKRLNILNRLFIELHKFFINMASIATGRESERKKVTSNFFSRNRGKWLKQICQKTCQKPLLDFRRVWFGRTFNILEYKQL